MENINSSGSYPQRRHRLYSGAIIKAGLTTVVRVPVTMRTDGC